MSRIPWTSAEIELLRREYADAPGILIAMQLNRPISKIYNKAKQLGLKKSAAFLKSIASGRVSQSSIEHGIHIGGRFVKGQYAWNTGTKGLTGMHPESRRTQFKKGTVNGMAAIRKKPLGTVRITKDGITQRKIKMDGKPKDRWKSEHSLLWSKHHGAIPAGHIVVFKDGNIRNIDLENLELLSLAENMKRNSYHNYPQPIPQLIQLRGVLMRKINQRRTFIEKQD